MLGCGSLGADYSYTYTCAATSACVDIGSSTITLDGRLDQSDSSAKWKITGTGAISGNDATRILVNYGVLELDGITLQDAYHSSHVSPLSRAVDS